MSVAYHVTYTWFRLFTPLFSEKGCFSEEEDIDPLEPLQKESENCESSPERSLRSLLITTQRLVRYIRKGRNARLVELGFVKIKGMAETRWNSRTWDLNQILLEKNAVIYFSRTLQNLGLLEAIRDFLKPFGQCILEMEEVEVIAAQKSFCSP